MTIKDVPEVLMIQMHDDGHVRLVMDHESMYISSEPVESFDFRNHKGTEAFGVDFYDITDEEALHVINSIKFDYLNDEEDMCSCSRGEAEEQHDYYGIYCGKMCKDCFKEKYRQDAYENEDDDW